MNHHKPRSEAASAARRHWGTRPGSKHASPNQETDELPKNRHQDDGKPQGTRQDPISIDDEVPQKRTKPQVLASQLHILYCPSNKSANGNQDTIRLSDLIGDQSMVETFQFNFSIDVSLVLDYLHPQFILDQRKLTLVTGTTVVNSEIATNFPFIKEILAPLPDRFGTHHTKMMINFFQDNTMEIVIMTANFTKLDFGGLTQMCWKSGKLPRGKKTHFTRGKNFQKDLSNYLLKYRNNDLNQLSKRLNDYGFDAVTVDLVASAPGYYNLKKSSDSEIYGYGKLYQVLKRNHCLLNQCNDDKKYNILAQVSSIASPILSAKGKISSIFTHVLCPIISGDLKLLSPGEPSMERHQSIFNYKPHLVYPSIQDMIKNDLGFGAGQMLHFKYTRQMNLINQYNQTIKPYLYKWNNDADITGRETTLPHVKLYMCDNGDNWNSLKWILMCSHNLSKQAWGFGQSKQKGKSWDDIHEYKVSSYELGVLVTPSSMTKLSPSYKSDTLANVEPIRLPIYLPPTEYNKLEQPFSQLQNYGDLKDKFNQTYHGLDELTNIGS